jgi:hypothetical protein
MTFVTCVSTAGEFIRFIIKSDKETKNPLKTFKLPRKLEKKRCNYKNHITPAKNLMIV